MTTPDPDPNRVALLAYADQAAAATRDVAARLVAVATEADHLGADMLMRRALIMRKLDEVLTGAPGYMHPTVVKTLAVEMAVMLADEVTAR